MTRTTWTVTRDGSVFVLSRGRQTVVVHVVNGVPYCQWCHRNFVPDSSCAHAGRVRRELSKVGRQ